MITRGVAIVGNLLNWNTFYLAARMHKPITTHGFGLHNK